MDDENKLPLEQQMLNQVLVGAVVFRPVTGPIQSPLQEGFMFRRQAE